MSNLKTYRILKGMKQKELASKLGISAACVAVMERKGIFDTRVAVKYARVLKCNPVFLLDGLDTIQFD